ncbi:MAG: hypothetical protein WCL44_04740 [bacterium]
MSGIRYRTVRGWQRAVAFVCAFISDNRAQALTEYVVLMLVVSTACFWLYYPHNGIFHAFRSRYDVTAVVLSLPGP